MDPSMYALAAIGSGTLLVIGLRLITFVQHYFLYSFSFSKYRGDWAVITGASGGIGAGIAHALAKRGVNVILIARSADKLERLASECHEQHSVDAKVITYDFSTVSSDPASLSALLEQVKAYKPTIIVNNVGINVDFPTELVDMDEDLIKNIIDINVKVTTAFTYALLPGLIDAAKGIVLCLSSAGGVVTPAPLLAVYAGTKAYNDSFAVSLAGEVKRVGNIHVHSLTPFFVESAMAKMRASFTVPSAKAFADKALSLVGSPYPRLQPYWVHYVMQSALTALPVSFQLDYVTKLHRNIRKRALRKKERMEKAAQETSG